MSDYTFTGDQLVRLLTSTIDMFCEYQDQHGGAKETARLAAVLEMLDGLSAEQELYQAEAKRLRGALESIQEYAGTDIEQETPGVMTTSIRAIAQNVLEPKGDGE